jgi:hypothetical protein
LDFNLRCRLSGQTRVTFQRAVSCAGNLLAALLVSEA